MGILEHNTGPAVVFIIRGVHVHAAGGAARAAEAAVGIGARAGAALCAGGGAVFVRVGHAYARRGHDTLGAALDDPGS